VTRADHVLAKLDALIGLEDAQLRKLQQWLDRQGGSWVGGLVANQTAWLAQLQQWRTSLLWERGEL
jgi:hypothetical protein